MVTIQQIQTALDQLVERGIIKFFEKNLYVY